MQRTKDQQKLSWEGMFYSIQRIDLLIISICGAGIYLCLETMKFSFENNLPITNTLKGAAIIFLFSIVVNFMSQFLGYKANEKDYLKFETEIEAGDNISEHQISEIINYDESAECYSNFTIWFNYLSVVLMFAGLILTIVYFLTTF